MSVSPCEMWQGRRNNRGYGVLSIRGRETLAHRYVMAQRHGEDGLIGKIVMHLCDNPPCVNPEHLRIGTHSDNITDMWRKGRGPAHDRGGERSSFAKLTSEQVDQIRNDDRTLREIAADYGVHLSTISLIRRGKTWR